MLGGKWYIDGEETVLHKEYVYALGNHCLIEDSKNSAARNKVPSDKARIYVGSDFKTTFAVGNKINVSGTWDVKEIEENSEEMMEALVSHYDV